MSWTFICRKFPFYLPFRTHLFPTSLSSQFMEWVLYLIYAFAIFGLGTAGDKLSYHKNNKFTTKDQDNDMSTVNCAKNVKGGWWYHDCRRSSDLNGVYLKGTHPRFDSVKWGDIRAAKRAKMTKWRSDRSIFRITSLDSADTLTHKCWKPVPATLA
jgi:hypothetical protein